MNWANRQLSIGVLQLGAFAVVVALLFIWPPLALIAMVGLAVPTLGLSSVLAFLAVVAIILAVLT